MYILEVGNILPAQGIGAFSLGMSYNQIMELTKDFEIEELDNSFIIICADVKLWIDKDSEKCTQILVQKDFKGKYHGSIGIGSTLADINRLGLEWYEDLDAYFIRDIEGICFEIADTENTDDKWDEKQMPIAYIAVFKD